MRRGSACSSGSLTVRPNFRNVIPWQMQFSVDFRNLAQAGLDRMDAALRTQISALAEAGRSSVAITPVVKFEPCLFDAACVASVVQAANALGLAHMEVVSGAGHDAVYVAAVAPAGMIFVPCKEASATTRLRTPSPNTSRPGPMCCWPCWRGRSGREVVFRRLC